MSIDRFGIQPSQVPSRARSETSRLTRKASVGIVGLMSLVLMGVVIGCGGQTGNRVMDLPESDPVAAEQYGESLAEREAERDRLRRQSGK